MEIGKTVAEGRAGGDGKGDESNNSNTKAVTNRTSDSTGSSTARVKIPAKFRVRNPADMPRRPLCAYNLFFRQERLKIVAERRLSGGGGGGGAGGRNGNLPTGTGGGEGNVVSSGSENDTSKAAFFETMAQTVGRRWRELSKEGREPFSKAAAIDGQRYKREMDVYKRLRAEKRDMAKLLRQAEKEAKKKRGKKKKQQQQQQLSSKAEGPSMKPKPKPPPPPPKTQQFASLFPAGHQGPAKNLAVNISPSRWPDPGAFASSQGLQPQTLAIKATHAAAAKEKQGSSGGGLPFLPAIPSKKGGRFAPPTTPLAPRPSTLSSTSAAAPSTLLKAELAALGGKASAFYPPVGGVSTVVAVVPPPPQSMYADQPSVGSAFTSAPNPAHRYHLYAAAAAGAGIGGIGAPVGGTAATAHVPVDVASQLEDLLLVSKFTQQIRNQREIDSLLRTLGAQTLLQALEQAASIKAAASAEGKEAMAVQQLLRLRESPPGLRLQNAPPLSGLHGAEYPPF